MDVMANNGAAYATAEEAVASLGKTAITGYTFVSGTEGFGNEGPENLWDGDTATKFCTGTYPTISIVALDGEYAIDGIAMATANDNAEYPGRAPFEWAVYGSKDGATWTAFAYGDDYFFEDVNFTYYAAPVTTADTYKYVMFQSEGGLAGVFQVSAFTGNEEKRGYPDGDKLLAKPRGHALPDPAHSGEVAVHHGIEAGKRHLQGKQEQRTYGPCVVQPEKPEGFRQKHQSKPGGKTEG
jgi:hypothetical protein